MAEVMYPRNMSDDRAIKDGTGCRKAARRLSSFPWRDWIASWTPLSRPGGHDRIIELHHCEIGTGLFRRSVVNTIEYCLLKQIPLIGRDRLWNEEDPKIKQWLFLPKS